MSGSDRRPSRMSRSVPLALPYVLEWSGVPPGCPGVVGSPSQISGVVGGPSRSTTPNVLEWWGGPLGCPRGLEDIREWTEDPPGCLGLVRRPPDVR